MSGDNGFYRAKYSEWLASLTGGCLIAVGVGALLSHWIKPLAPFLVLVGAAVHAWGMYKMHRRNP